MWEEETLRAFLRPLFWFGYLSVLFALTMAPHPESQEHPLRLIPFRTIWDCFQQGGWIWVVNILGNLAAFVPLGFLRAESRPELDQAGKVVLYSFLLSAFIEALQLASGQRIADIDDVLLNSLGGLLGFGICRLFRGVVTRRASEAAC